MLVLKRKPGHAIVIDGRIVVKVLAQRGRLVSIGIEADPGVHIVRAELLDEDSPLWPLIQERPSPTPEAA